MDSQLMEFFQVIAEAEVSKRSSKQHERFAYEPAPLIDFNVASPFLQISDSQLQSYPLISHIPLAILRLRFTAIQLFNQRLSQILPLVDFTQTTNNWSLAHRLSCLSAVILREVKHSVWQYIMQTTSSGGGHVTVTVNRPRAMKAREKGDTSGTKSVFGQIYRQLHFVKPASLRTAERPWRIIYEGEGGTDAGGLFRDSLSHICGELQSSATPLFIPAKSQRDLYVPNPSQTSSLSFSMFAFVGKLMGMCIRSSHVLNLDFPSLVWKLLCGATPTLDDVRDFDDTAFAVVDRIRELEREGAFLITPQERFATEFPSLHFVTSSADGRQVNLCDDGANMLVTYANRHHYISLLEQFRLTEFDLAVSHIRRGLGTIVPVPLLPLFTPNEVEAMICGRRDISVPYLRANTRFRAPLHATDDAVLWLWRALESFSSKEKQLFLRFVNGMSRLPSNPADFMQKFELTPARFNTDQDLPVSHTCFFSLELPRYSSYDILRAKLLYAICNCTAIDTDFNTESSAWGQD